MKLDLTREQHAQLEVVQDVIYEQINALTEQRDGLLYECKGAMGAFKMHLAEQAVEIGVLIGKLKETQSALNELIN